MTDEKDLLKVAEQETNINPTEAEIASGDYQKGEFETEGLKIVIENPAGSIRSGVDECGNAWSNEITFTYGYIDNTVGSDGDAVDVFLGPLIGSTYDVYVICQICPETGIFDEHKVMLGFDSVQSAEQGYLSNYSDDWKGLGSTMIFSIIDFKKWLANKSLNNENNKEVMIETKPGPTTKIVKLEGQIIENVTLLDLQKQAGDLTNIELLVVEIASPGGSVCEGLNIMVWFDSLSAKGIEVMTVVTANAYSIASLIMLAANYRVIARSADVMVHNPVVPEITYANANQLESHIVQLRELESIMYELYEIFTGLSPEKMKILMDNETYLNAEEAVEYGFADEIADLKPRSKSVLTINDYKITDMKNTLNVLMKVISQVTGAEFVNQLYYDSTGGEIEIYQNDPSTYAVGDKTSLAEGTVTLSDGSVLTIVGNVITDITKPVAAPAVEAPAAETPVVETPAAPATPAPAEEKPAAAFNEGPAPATTETKPEEKPAAEAPATEEKPVIEAPAAAEAPVVETPATEAPETPAEEAEEGLVKADDPTIVAIWAAIEELKAALGVETDMVAKVEALEKFEDIATQAIQAIAAGTTSSFKPDAIQTVGDAPKGTIFQQLRAKAEAAKKA
jgi:ATP-dependent protease ClpP protease subunit